MQRSKKRKLVRTGRIGKGFPLATGILAAAPVALAQQTTTAGGLEEIIVTAQKREESLQTVPLSVQAIATERLEQLQIKDFADYVKFLPSVTYTTLGPGFSLPYFRGVAGGENNNHSGPQPSVGMYLDEQPITTIQGSLDVHLYDIARVEALAGPQGTLYGASSQAGTIRIITNKPDSSTFDAAYGVEGNMVAHGDAGYLFEGFVNIPISSAAAVRLVGWARHDAGYIDNVAGTRVYPSPESCISNARTPPAGCLSTPIRAEDDFNDADTYGGRAALRIDLNDSWTITPTIMGQKQEANGLFAYDPAVGDLEVTHFYKDWSEDKWWQAALTVEGKIGNFDVVYAGAYLKRDDVVDADYSDYSYHYDALTNLDNLYEYVGYIAYYFGDETGTMLADQSQYVHGTDGYKRQSHEVRISSPQDNRFRFVAGLFYQDQEHEIFQNYKVNGLYGFPDGAGGVIPIEVPGWNDTIWLTNQLRNDQEQAIFGEFTFDITEALSATAGIRYFENENSIKGFFGYGTADYSTNYGVAKCFSDEQYNGSPCTNIDDKIDDSGNVPKFNLTYRFDEQRLVYATYSEGYRPGGINRNNVVPPYKPDYLTNYELGWKTTWAGNSLRLNGAIFHEEWEDIQYSFLPPGGSGLSVIKNAGSAEINGIEMDLTWAATPDMVISGGLTWLDAKLTEDYVQDPAQPLTGAVDGDRLPVTPEFKANVIGRYTFDVGGLNTNVQAAVVYNGSSYSDLPRLERLLWGEQASYTIVDLSAGIAWDDYSLELYVNNAFDELGRTFTYAQCTTTACGDQPYYVPNQPRTIGLKFTQEF